MFETGRGVPQNYTEAAMWYRRFRIVPRHATAGLEHVAEVGLRRRIAVLGEMKELGADSEQLHADLAEPVAAARVSRVFTLGDAMAAMRQALEPALLAPHAGSVEELESLLRSELSPGDVVLIKGSHGSHVGDVVPRLTGSGAGRTVH